MNKKKTFITICLFFLTSCITTNISLAPINSDVKRLAIANNKPICINIKSSKKTLLGHQFVIPFIPVGKVVLESSQKRYISSSLYKNLSIGQFTPIFNSQTCEEVINLKINKISLSAYDFFVTRHIVAKINYEIIYIKDGILQDSIKSSSESSTFKRFAFKSELEYALNTASKKLSRDIIELLSNHF